MDNNDTAFQIHTPNNDNLEESFETARGRRTQRLQRNDDWTKTRNYLYRHNAAAAAAAANNANSHDKLENKAVTVNNCSNETNSKKQKRKKKRQQGEQPLTISKIQNIINFLNITFPNQPELQARVIQYSPRILSQYHSVHSRLLPTVEFLRALYGPMDQQQQQHEGVKGSKKMEEEEEGGVGRFYEAIYRNTDLLLIRGVGYAGSSSSNQPTNKNYDEVDDSGGVGGGGGGNDDNALAVVQYLTNDLLSTNETARLKQNHPTLFQLSLDTKIIPVLDYLRSLLLSHNNSFKKVQQVLKKIITQYPMLLQLDIETNLNYTVSYLRDTFDFTNEELTTFVSISPGVLGLSVLNNLLPTINFMRDILKVCNNVDDANNNDYDDGNDDDEEEGSNSSLTILLRRCVLTHHQILSLSLGNLLAKREYFDSIDASMMDSINNKDMAQKITTTTTLAARILMSTPSVYSLSLQQNIIPKVNYLATALWGSNRTTISNNLYEYPQILTLSMQGNIIPTLSFYNMTGYIRLDTHGLPEELSSIQQQEQTKVSIRSRYIATSLYNRLLPRWHYLLEEHERIQQLQYQILSSLEESISDSALYENIINATTTTTISPTLHLLPPLHLLAGASDSIFCYQMKLSLTEYLIYKEKEGARLKFSSQFDTWLKTGRPIDLDD